MKKSQELRANFVEKESRGEEVSWDEVLKSVQNNLSEELQSLADYLDSKNWRECLKDDNSIKYMENIFNDTLDDVTLADLVSFFHFTQSMWELRDVLKDEILQQIAADYKTPSNMAYIGRESAILLGLDKENRVDIPKIGDIAIDNYIDDQGVKGFLNNFLQHHILNPIKDAYSLPQHSEESTVRENHDKFINDDNYLSINGLFVALKSEFSHGDNLVRDRVLATILDKHKVVVREENLERDIEVASCLIIAGIIPNLCVNILDYIDVEGLILQESKDILIDNFKQDRRVDFIGGDSENETVGTPCSVSAVSLSRENTNGIANDGK